MVSTAFRPTLVLVAVWLLACLFGPVLLSAAGVGINLHGHAHLHAHGHPFVDARTLWGVPNAMDVLSNASGVRLGALISIYALAKLFELGDGAVFHATGDTVSGHSLKHVTAAFAVWPVWSALRQNPRASGRATVPAAQ